jgi:hypothetical protein
LVINGTEGLLPALDTLRRAAAPLLDLLAATADGTPNSRKDHHQ